MKKVLFVAALAILSSVAVTAKATAQEVCVNRSLADEAKRLFPNAHVHVIPDSTDPNMNGWRIVYGTSHTEAEELRLRLRENHSARVIE